MESNKRAVVIYIVIGFILGSVFTKAVNVKIEIRPKLRRFFSKLTQSSISVKNEPIRDVLELCYFESENDLKKIEKSNIKMERSQKYVSEGEYSLRCVFHQGDSGVSFYGTLPKNWSGYKNLKFDVYGEDDNIPLSLFVADANNISYNDRYNREGIMLNKGWNSIVVPIDEIDKKLILDRINHLIFFLWNVPGSHVLYFDNIKLTSREENSNNEDFSTESFSGAIEVSIFPTRLKRPISDLLYGSNLSPKMESDLKIKEFIKGIRLTCFRYPGGDSPGWHWREGTADFNSKVKDMLLGDIDFLIEFCKLTNTKLIMQVNIESGTPEEAAGLVQHLNKEAGFKVVYWELGNEPYGDWDKAYTTAEDYAKLIKRYSEAMKAIDPTIKIGAAWADSRNWDQKIIQDSADYIDFVSVHWYPNHTNKTHKYEGRIHPTAEEVMSNSMEIPNIIQRIKKTIEKYALHRKGRIEIAFLEWDGAWDAPSSDPTPPYAQGVVQWSLANAIFYADCLGQFAENEVTVSTHYNLQECMFGLIRGWDPAEGWGGMKWDMETIRPKAFAIELFFKHFGDILIESRVINSPYYYKTEDWWPSSYSGKVPYITCYVSKFSDAEKLGIILINKHSEQDFDLNIFIDENVKLKGYSDIWILTGPNIMSQNDGQPGTVKISQLERIKINNNFKYILPKHSVIAMEIELL